MTEQNTLPMPESKSVAVQEKKPAKEMTIVDIVQSDAYRKQFQMALPAMIKPERFIRIAITALRKTPKLTECKQTSLLAALLYSAQLGLEPNTPLGHAYLIPYGQECQFIIGYQGLMDLAYRSGLVKSIMVFDRCKNDAFNMQWGLYPNIEHTPAEGDRGEVIGYYAVAKVQEGESIFCYMSMTEIEKHKKQYSKAGSGFSPWSTAPAEMAKKTVIRRLIKMLPKATEKALSQFSVIQDGIVKGMTEDNTPDIETADYEVMND